MRLSSVIASRELKVLVCKRSKWRAGPGSGPPVRPLPLTRPAVSDGALRMQGRMAVGGGTPAAKLGRNSNTAASRKGLSNGLSPRSHRRGHLDALV